MTNVTNMEETATVSMSIGNEVIGVFVKSGGQREVLGRILQEKFTDPSSIKELLSKGAIVDAGSMSLYSETEPEIWKSTSISEFIDKHGMKHNYVFDTEQNAWMDLSFIKMCTAVN